MNEQTMKMKIEGLHLWKVGISYIGDNGGRRNSNLWITTKNFSPEAAFKKARTFLKRKMNTAYPGAAILGVQNDGTLDA
jgi:hypothetical protein